MSDGQEGFPNDNCCSKLRVKALEWYQCPRWGIFIVTLTWNMLFLSQYMSSYYYTEALCRTVGKIFEKQLRRSFFLLRLQTLVDLQENWNEFLRWRSQGFFAFENHFLQWKGSVWARFFDAIKLFPNLLKKNQIVDNIKRHSPIFSITVKNERSKRSN